jgi:hypothetical protein
MPTCLLLVIAALGISVGLSAQEQPQLDAKAHQPVITEFDAPGASTAAGLGTDAFGINNGGEIVGAYTDMNIVPHGFLRAVNGKITSFDAPGAGLADGADQGTAAYSVNNSGVIAGQFEDANNVFHGFVRTRHGKFTTFDAPGAGTGANQGTLAFCINPKGETAGISIDGSNLQHVFVRSRSGKITTIDAPGAGGNFGTFLYNTFTCLNPKGAITGIYGDANNILHGFLRAPDGKITEFDAPGGGTSIAQGTYSESINPGGVITGYIEDSNYVAHGFVRLSDGTFTTFDVPDAALGANQGTGTASINSSKTVTGDFTDANNAYHGYSRSPGGTFTTLNAPDAGTGAGQGTRPTTNNAAGDITGFFTDGNNVNHGFLWGRRPRR